MIIKREDLMKNIQEYLDRNNMEVNDKNTEEFITGLKFCLNNFFQLIDELTDNWLTGEEYEDGFNFTQNLMIKLDELYKGEIEGINLVKLFRESVKYSEYDCIIKNLLSDGYFENIESFYYSMGYDALPYLKSQNETLEALNEIAYGFKDSHDGVEFVGYIMFDYLRYIYEHGEDMEFIEEFYPEHKKLYKPKDLLGRINNVSKFGKSVFDEMKQWSSKNFTPSNISDQVYSLIDFRDAILMDNIITNFYSNSEEELRCKALDVKSPLDKLHRLEVMDFSDFKYNLDSDCIEIINNKDFYLDCINALIDCFSENAHKDEAKVEILEKYKMQFNEAEMEEEEELER